MSGRSNMKKKIVNPALFSTKFKIPSKLMDAAGLFDPLLNGDTKLYVDPLLLQGSKNKIIATNALDALKKRFSDILSLVQAAPDASSKAWRTALELLDLSEADETCLGYGSNTIGGSSRPLQIKQQILATSKEILELGESNPQIISLMGIFEEGVGPDTISDLTINTIRPILEQITEDFCVKNGVPVRSFDDYSHKLPENPYRQGTPIILVPQDLLRHLPIANDWYEVGAVVNANARLRKRFNDLISDVAKATVTEKKHAMKEAALSSLQNFKALLEAMLNNGTHYDPNEDLRGYYAFRSILNSDLFAFKGAIKPSTNPSKAELARIVVEIIENCRHQIENHNLWELLWHNDVPKYERAAQLVFYGLADVFCKANNIDISPEMKAGGGPVDFKFSTGYKNRYLVEVKLSTGAVVSGYKKQLELYKKASDTDYAALLIFDVGGLKRKLKTVQSIRTAKLAAGEKTSDIFLIDASKKKFPSKA